MSNEANKLRPKLRAGQTLYLVLKHPSAYVLEDRPWYYVRSIRVLSDKAPAPVVGEEVHAAPRRWLESRVPLAAFYKSRRQAERYRKAFQARSDRANAGGAERDR